MSENDIPDFDPPEFESLGDHDVAEDRFADMAGDWADESAPIHLEAPATEPPTYKLHPLIGVVCATMAGSPVPGGVVLALNYWRSGRPIRAALTLVGGVVVTALVFAWLIRLPAEVFEKPPNLVLLIPQVALVYLVASVLQSRLIREHVRRGGDMASGWRSMGVALLCLPFVAGLAFGLAKAMQPDLGTLLEFGNDEIYYAGEATEDDARRLATTLEDAGILESSGATIHVDAVGGEYSVSFIVADNSWNDPELTLGFRELGQVIAEEVFDTPLKIRLWDRELNTRKTILIELTEL